MNGKSSLSVLVASLLGLALVLPLPGHAAEPIKLPWTERSPFMYRDADGRLGGILFELGETLFAAAHVPMQWSEVPANRIIQMLSRNEERVCLVGWFKTPEREAMGRFTSLPIYQDKPVRAVQRRQGKLKSGASMQQVVDNLTYVLLIKQGYSYGSYFDKLIEQRAGQNVEKVLADHARMLQMVKAGRADLVFMPQEEIDHHAARTPNFASDFEVRELSDLPSGNERYIICSKRVLDEEMLALDQAIRTGVKRRP